MLILSAKVVIAFLLSFAWLGVCDVLGIDTFVIRLCGSAGIGGLVGLMGMRAAR